MQKTVVVLILFCLVGNCRAGETITITFFQAAPHIMFDASTGNVSGALFELLEEFVAPEMGALFVWDPATASVPRQISLLKQEQRDAAALLMYTPQRAQAFIFSKQPIAISKPVLGVLTENRLDHVGRVEDISGLTIGYTTGTYISPFMRDDRIRFDFVSSGQPNEINVKKLLKGRIDCVYTPDKSSLLMAIKNLGADGLVRILDLPEAPGRVHIVFSKKNAALAGRFDAAYARINGDTRYLKLLSKYFDISKL